MAVKTHRFSRTNSKIANFVLLSWVIEGVHVFFHCFFESGENTFGNKMNNLHYILSVKRLH